MKLARLAPAALALMLVGSWAIAEACDNDKASRATSSAAKTKLTTKLTAVNANVDANGKVCTPEQMAACAAHKSGTKTSAYTASSSSTCASKSTATTAMTASAGGSCSDHGKSTATAVTASAGESCGDHGSAKASKTASAKGKVVDAYSAGSGSSCSGHGIAKAAGKSAHAHGDCDACADMSACGDELTTAGAQTQIVSLKNGVMFVYTADSPSQVNAVQAAMSRRSDRMAQFATASSKAKLCAECKSMRSAMASGKLIREVVNIEGGSLTLMTSEDPAVVAKIHAMVDGGKTAQTSRTKS